MCEMTMGEAAAWRGGYEISRAQSWSELLRMARELRARGCASEAATLETAAEAVWAIKRPDPTLLSTELDA